MGLLGLTERISGRNAAVPTPTSSLISMTPRNELKSGRTPMNALRDVRNLWMPMLTTVALVCFGDAAAHVRYIVTDLGSEGNDDLGCAMALNDQGWTEIMAGVLVPTQVDFSVAAILSGRALIDVDGFKTDLGT